MIIEYLREIDAGTPNACWVGCAKGDPGARPFVLADEMIPCRHEAYQGRCVHCDIPFRFGQPDFGEVAA